MTAPLPAGTWRNLQGQSQTGASRSPLERPPSGSPSPRAHHRSSRDPSHHAYPQHPGPDYDGRSGTDAGPHPSAHDRGPALTVSAVVDGDTVDLSNGERVQIIGIDTPEQGQPGYAEAAAAMSAMVLGHEVVLTPGARDDRDSYGRLLRYVDVNGQDTGLAMINQGWAIARYDSRDGYGHHAREDSYVAADAASLPAYTVAPPPPPPAPLARSPAAATDPNMGTCKAAKAAGYGPYVAGQDPEYDWYRDADSDGVVCE